jgi:DNA-binding winged helix-turn-helix (wHTH) protein
MAVLVCLASCAGSLVRHDELIHEVWGPRGATSDLVSRAIGELRRTFGDEATTGRFIETITKSGYCLRAQVGPISASNRREPLPHKPRCPPRVLRRWVSPAIASGMSFAAVAIWSALICGT